MAKMIPPTVHQGTKSPGEISLFEKLRRDAACVDWTVLHSLDIPQHVTRAMGEIDFVIIVPNLGVLCLSVKHHSQVTRTEDGIWHLGRDLPCSQGPFKKARDDMFSLKARISKSVPRVAGVPFAFAVLFTRASPMINLGPVEWEPDEQIFGKQYESPEFMRILVGCLMKTRTRMKVPEGVVRPDSIDIEAMVQFLRPTLEFFIAPKDRERATLADLKRYTEEQTESLDDATYNERMLFVGPAGTGKTLLATEMLRREVNDSKKSILLCFNKPLCESLQNETSDPKLRIQTIDSLLLQIYGRPAPDNPSSAFWDHDLPAGVLEKLVQEMEVNQFDSIIIDEAQDVLREKYLDVLDLLLKGGLKKGRWIMFGDFMRQAIYASSFDWKSFAKSNNSSIRTLSINCRNTKMIAKYAEILGGMSPGYSMIRREGDGAAPEISVYSNSAQQGQLLKETVEAFLQHYKKNNIVILSAKKDSEACVNQLRAQRNSFNVEPYSVKGSEIRHSSIHRFKGLESMAIIVTDIESIGSDERASLLYIATTRAIDRLAILAHSSVQKEIMKVLIR